MAKAKKRAAARKKSAKRSKASVKPTSKKTAKRVAAKPRVKAKVRRATKSATKSAQEVRPQEAAVAEKAIEIEKSVETTIIAAVEAPTPSVVAVVETVDVTTSTLAEEEGSRPARDLDIWSSPGEPPEKKVA
jgi:hypothetical protein